MSTASSSASSSSSHHHHPSSSSSSSSSSSLPRLLMLLTTGTAAAILSLFFLNLTHAADSASTSTLLIPGVPPSMEAQYLALKDQGKYQCQDKAKTIIKFSQLNDNYCDCPNGSDEPGTSACGTLGQFYCQNKGHVGAFIPSSHVGDGVCEPLLCCDGSDEKPGVCPNTCASIAKAARAKYTEQLKLYQAGASKKKTYVKEGKTAAESRAKEISTLQSKKSKAVSDVAEAKGIKEKTETEEKEEQARVLNERMAKLKAGLKVDSLATEELVVLYGQLKKKGGSGKVLKVVLEEIKTKAGIVEEEKEEGEGENKYVPEGEDDEEDEEYPYDEEGGYEEEEGGGEGEGGEAAAGQAEEKEKEKEAEAEPALDPAIEALLVEVEEGVEVKLATATAARDGLRLAEEEEKEVMKKLVELEGIHEQDYGDEFQFFALREKCFSLTVNKYRYEMCPYKDAQQIEGSGSYGTKLGTWKGLERVSEDGSFRFLFQNGQKCWNGPERSLTVSVTCGATEDVKAVDEPNMCEYTMEFTSPAACSRPPPPLPKEEEGIAAAAGNVHKEL